LAPLVEGRWLDEEKDLMGELQGVFRCALDIKTLGMTSNHVFDCIWPIHGAVIENNSMAEDSLSNDVSSEKVKTVMLTLVPGIRVYNHKRKFVDYCNFTTGGEEGLDESELIGKAVIMSQ
jgi:hypothetical protein